MTTLFNALDAGLFDDDTDAKKVDHLLHDANEVDTKPRFEDVRDFIGTLKNYWTATPAQDAALDKVVAKGSGFFHGTGALPWRHFEREIVALQLIIRIVDFKYIEQKTHPLCGPVSFMQGVAKRDPAAYAQYVIDLATTRKGTIDNLKVKVRSGSGLLGKHPHREHIKEADYIALASLRNQNNVFPYRAPWTNRTLEGASTAYTVIKWMKDAGFSNVEDHTHAMWRITGMFQKETRESVAAGHMRRHLWKMQKHLKDGDVVLMSAAGNLAHAIFRETTRDSKVQTIFGGHFMMVRSVSVGADGATFDIVSWGQTQPNPPEIPWSKIGSWYQGFVCGKP